MSQRKAALEAIKLSTQNRDIAMSTCNHHSSGYLISGQCTFPAAAGLETPLGDNARVEIPDADILRIDDHSEPI
jgi:hypothetical protein